MTRKWTIFAVFAVSISGAAVAETSDLRGAIGSTSQTLTDPYGDELLGGLLIEPLAETEMTAPFTAASQPLVFVQSAPAAVYAPQSTSPEIVNVRYVVSETTERAPEPARVEGLLTWQGRNY